MRRWCSSIIAPPSPPGSEAFVQAVKEGDRQEVRRRLKCTFLRRRELLNSSDSEGVPCLHWAVRNSNREMLRLLVRKGASLGSVDSEGRSVVHQAARARDRDVMAFLLDNGGTSQEIINQKTKHGHTPLHTAVRADGPEIVSLLLESGADVNITDTQGWSPLHLAVIRGHSDCVVSILHFGIKVDMMTRGWTSLHLAALTDRVDIVSLLINGGADTSLINGQGKTALDIARESDNGKTAAIILEREFQSGLCLPTPPHTPATPRTNIATLERWRQELARDLGRFDQDDLHDEDSDSDSDGDNPNFEVEKSKLIEQIENVRQKQIADIKTKIQNESKKHEECVSRISRRAKILVCEIQGLQENIPTIRENIDTKFKDLKEEIIHLSEEIDALRNQSDLMTKLKTAVTVTSEKYLSGHLKKSQLVQKLVEVHEREVKELSELKTIKMKELGCCESEAETNVQRVMKKIQVLQDQLSGLEKEKKSKSSKHKLDLLNLQEELKRAECRRIMEEGEVEEFSCPLCLGILTPHMKIFQCPEGRILCESCKNKSDQLQPSSFSRNRALEALIANRNNNLL